MSLNSKYLIQSDLQSHFVDKDSGLPLQAGYIEFYKDTARTTPKNVFILDGTPPYSDNSYTNIGNEVTLGPGGNIMYDNNDVILYYYPYDTNGNVELYFVQIYNENDVLQKTLEAWPNTIGVAGDDENVKNYITNGQFFSHTDIPEQNGNDAGRITAEETDFASGGWRYKQTSGSTATRYLTFERIDSDSGNPTGAPRWWLRTQTISLGVSPGSTNQFSVRFYNVNQFSSDTQEYTIAFTAKNNLSGTLPVTFATYKYFGTGGSPATPVSTDVHEFDIGTQAIYQFAFTFGSNTGDNVGTNNDDYLDLVFKLPPDTPYDLQFTDFLLAPNDVTLQSYPQTPMSDVIANSIAGYLPLPNPDGSNLYLTPRLTKDGMQWDDSEIGMIVQDSSYTNSFSGSLSTATNLMLADGSKYLTTDYSPLGIPYSRLFNKYYNSSIQTPIWGTGANYFTATYPVSNVFRIVNNSAGVVTATSDGGATTGFTFTNVHTGTTTNFVTAAMASSTSFYIVNNSVGAVTDASQTGNASFTPITVVQSGNSLVPEITSITCPAGASVIAGSTGPADHYISFYPVGGATSQYYIWYTVDGVGTDPAVASATGVRVNIASTDTAAIVAQKTQESLNGWNDTQITTVAAAALNGGDYFLVSATGADYYVWYKKDGAGSDPAIGLRTGIEVNVLSADTAALVAQKTQAAINSYSFAVPDAQGLFTRARDNSSGNDPDAATRWSLVPGIIGDMVGTSQFTQNISHVHGPFEPGGQSILTSFDTATHPLDIPNPGSQFDGYADTTGPSGGKQSNPANIYLTYLIRY